MKAKFMSVAAVLMLVLAPAPVAGQALQSFDRCPLPRAPRQVVERGDRAQNEPAVDFGITQSESRGVPNQRIR